jgi:outer membrane lipoprotein-sorting protein/methionine-rich copper-binding protein CopC
MMWRIAKSQRTLSMLVSLVLLTATAPAFAQEKTSETKKSAQEIIDASLDKNALGFQSGRADLALIIEDKAGSRRVRKLDVKSKKLADATHTLVELTAPKEVRGQTFLFAENKKSEDNVWMYVPAFKVTRRIEGSQKSGSFLGSHFTYADLESRDLKDAKYKRLKDDKIGEHAVFVIESTPAKGSDYSKIISYIRKSDSMPLKMRFFDGSGDEAKTLFVEKLDKTDAGQTFVERMTLRPKDGGFTTIKFESFDDNVDLADSLFSKGQLGK